MRVLLSGALLCAAACRFTGADGYYGVSKDDMRFAEVDFVLTDAEGGRVQGVPFLVAGEGTLPAEYGPERESFQRLSGGMKARYPIPLFGGKLVLFLESGGMVSYYQADAIGTPYELELLGGLGALVGLGNGWMLDLAGRLRYPTGNGNNHDRPEHAPHGEAVEIAIGLRKDF